jgi:hypothetical protein
MSERGRSPGTGKGSCPFLWERGESPGRVIQGYCRDPQTGATWIPSFWDFWNRCRSERYILCRRYRFFSRQLKRLEAKAS